jgi:hypothetical protein
MVTRKSIGALFGVLVMSALIHGSVIQSGAETMNFKLYTYVIKAERIPIGDVEGHMMAMNVRGSFYVFENGEVATVNVVSTTDQIKGAGPFMQYATITFADGSTIIVKSQGTLGGTAEGVLASGGWKSEIIKGTGRYEGIKGTVTSKAKYLPVEKGEAGPKGIGEGTLTFTLSSK